MPSSFRTTRNFASWIELDYFRRRSLFGRWWNRLIVLGVVFSILGVVLLVRAKGQESFQRAPISPPHAMFQADCGLCHQNRGGGLARLWKGDTVGSVPDQACLQCHAGSSHNPPHAAMGRCVECHKEHQGHDALVRPNDRLCTKCHADLKRQDGSESNLHAHVTGFDNQGDHPPFRHSFGRDSRDPGSLRFNHRLHMETAFAELAKKRPDLALKRRLECQDCHQMDEAGRLMQPIRFEEHCQKCHPLSVQLDGAGQTPAQRSLMSAFARESIRHPRPGQTAAVVRADLRDRLVRFVTGPGGMALLGMKDAPPRPIPDHPVTEAPDEKTFAWVQRQMAQGERALFDGAGGCRYCHTVRTPAAASRDGLPDLAPTAVTAYWWKHARFAHETHRMVNCRECHPATTSANTADVLLPGIDTCVRCHNSRARISARTDCVECHGYHDPVRQKSARHHGTWKVTEAGSR